MEDLPLCTPFEPRKGEWRLDVPWDSGTPEPHQYWEPASDEPPCRYRVSSEADFLHCFRNKHLMLVGDSTARNLVMCLADFLGQCGSSQSAQRLGPDDPLAIKMCGESYAALRAHGDVLVVTPPSLGNVTLEFKWAPYVRDAAEAMRNLRPPSRGGPDAVVVTLGYWTAKDAFNAGGMGSEPMKQFLEGLPGFAAALKDGAAPSNPLLLKGHLVYGFAPYAEGKEANGGSHPRDVVDALNLGAEALLGSEGLGIPVFDGRWYSRVTPSQLEASNGKIVTWDGYHPAHAVVLTQMREYLSHFCGLPSWQLPQGPAAGASAASTAGVVDLVAPKSCSSIEIFSLPLLIIVLGSLLVYRLTQALSFVEPGESPSTHQFKKSANASPPEASSP